MTKQQFNWKGFQKHLGYTDEELAAFKVDPKRAQAATKLMSKEILKKDLIIEVVESHGCSTGMKQGDRLVFSGLAMLDLERSSKNWCAHAMGPMPMIATVAQDRYAAGLDPNEMLYNHFSCSDVGPMRNGWGQIIMKASVVDRLD